MIFLLGIALLIPYIFFWGTVLRTSLKAIPLEQSNSPLPKITLICSIRNEQDLLPLFLENIKTLELQQPNQLHFLFIDDQSTDNTNSILSEFIQSVSFADRVDLIKTSPENSGKKQALKSAFQIASTEWAYVTDADCITHWEAINYLFNAINNETKAVFGPVIYTFESNFLQSYQALENSALMILGAFQSAKNNKTMGNAANMLVNVASFNETKPFDNNLHIAGGDDIFLIEAFQTARLNIATISDTNAAVQTPVLKNWGELWHQRIRWAQKSRFQTLKNTQNSQILIVVFFVFFWSITFLLLNFAQYVEMAILWGAKIIFDVYLLDRINRFYHQKTALGYKMGASIFQTLFIPCIAIAQFFSKVRWKNRIY